MAFASYFQSQTDYENGGFGILIPLPEYLASILTVVPSNKNTTVLNSFVTWKDASSVQDLYEMIPQCINGGK